MSLNETLITIPVLTLPIPNGNIQIFWLLLGMQFGRSFGKRLDQGIQAGKWFNRQSDTVKGIVKRLLDFTHHWWIGGILWLYSTEIAAALGIPQHTIAVMFFGVGLLIDDIRDVENLKRRYTATPPDP